MNRRRSPTGAILLLVIAALVGFSMLAAPNSAMGVDNGLFEQMDIGLLSIGGRATYFDPRDGSSRWFGGAQVRLHPWRYLAFEGSADYRRNDIGDTRVHTYPVQVSALIYPYTHWEPLGLLPSCWAAAGGITRL